MSLIWNTAEGSPARATAADPQWQGALRAISFGLAIVGLGRITEENAAEVYARLKLAEHDGPFLTGTDEKGDKVYGFTPEIVARFVGLNTNVSNETEAKFLSRLGKSILRDGRARYAAKVKTPA